MGESGLLGRRGEWNAGLSQTGQFYLRGGPRRDVHQPSPDDDLEDRPFEEGVGARQVALFSGNHSRQASSRNGPEIRFTAWKISESGWMFVPDPRQVTAESHAEGGSRLGG